MYVCNVELVHNFGYACMKLDRVFYSIMRMQSKYAHSSKRGVWLIALAYG